jgi:hypothetical protein
MAYKLLESAEQGWRSINAPDLVPQVRSGAKFKDGKLVQTQDQQLDENQAA